MELQLGTKENQSFYYKDNKWKDLHNESSTARIKGLTVNAQTKSASHVSLSKTQTMIIGERKKLDVHLTSSTTDSKLLWQSSHPDIVEVDKNGYVTALSLGQATITVTTEYGATASCLIEVSEKDIGIKESQNTINDINKKDLKTKRVGQHIVNTSDKSVIDLYIFLLYFGGLGMMICIYKRKYL